VRKYIIDLLDKFAWAEMLSPRGTSGMKKELPEEFKAEIARSHKLLNRSKSVLSELGEMLERSRNLLEESYKIIEKAKARSPFKNDPER
jgi:hypothetical protein